MIDSRVLLVIGWAGKPGQSQDGCPHFRRREVKSIFSWFKSGMFGLDVICRMGGRGYDVKLSACWYPSTGW